MPTKRRDLQGVARWRQAQLIEAGFPRSLATRLARDERYDVHDLIGLVERGSSPALAASILEPSERDNGVDAKR